MEFPVSIRHQFCPNAVCPFYGKVLSGNVTVHSQKVRRMRCKACKMTWVSHCHDFRYGLECDRRNVHFTL